MYRIMVVDDDPTSLAISRALLESTYDLTLVRSGHQALGTLNSENLPDVILLDMVMPGLGGMEVLKAVKQDPRLRDIPVILITGDNCLETKLSSYHNGAADYLQKPLNPDMLRIRVEQQLHLRELIRENAALKAAVRELRAAFDRLLPPEEA